MEYLGKSVAAELTVTPEKSVDLPTPRSKAVSNPLSDIHNKVSNPTIVVCAENIADDPDNVTEPGKKSKSKSNIVEVTNSPSNLIFLDLRFQYPKTQIS